MSGPIIRTYGVSNWDEIFGKKDEKAEGETKASESAKAPAAETAKDGEKPAEKKPG